MSARRGHPLAVAGAVVAIGAAVGLQVLRDERYSLDERSVERILYVQSGSVLRRMAIGFDSLAADVYWIRALQHYGGQRRASLGERKYDLLYPLLDITTTLDPYFTIAYRFGAIFLAEEPPGGPGRPDLAVALLRKGLAAQAAKWQYCMDIGFVYYWHLGDFNTAAGWFQRASDQPNAPNWMRPLAATTLIRGGDRTSARFLSQQLLQADEPWLRRLGEKRLRQIDVLDQIDRLQPIVRRFPAPDGRYSWDALIRRHVLPGVPLDPTGAPYEVDPVTGDVGLSSRSELFPLPADIGVTLR
jgi:hypothetical protein